MRLLRLHIENFGVLKEVDLTFSDGVNVFCQDNGSGKSTLAAFLRIMLYGFDNETIRKDAELYNEREKYRPWQGGVYGGSLTFAVEDGTYEVTRIFADHRKDDEFILRELSTERESERFSPELGREILGMDADSFKRTLYLGQNACHSEQTGATAAGLSLTMAETETEGLEDYEAASARLKDLINAYSPSRKTGRCYRLKEEIEELRLLCRNPELADGDMKNGSELAYAVERSRDNSLSEAELKRLEELDARYGAGIPEERTLEKMLDLAQKRDDTERELIRYQTRMDTMEQLQRRKVVRGRETPDKDPEEGRSVTGAKLILIFSGLLLLIGGFLGAIYWRIEGCYVAAGGFALLIIGLLIRRSGRHQAEESYEEETEEEIQEEGEEELQREIEELDRMIRRESTLLDRIGEQLTAFLSLYDADTRLERATMTLMEFKTDLKEYQGLRERKERFAQATERFNATRTQLEDRLSSLEEEYRRTELFYDRIVRTKEYLDRAEESLGNRMRGPILEHFKAYYHRLAPQETADYRVDAAMTLSVQQYGLRHDVRTLSLGRRDLVGLCLRMALIETLYPEEKPFLIFDDPFANMDGLTTLGAMGLLKEIGSSCQVIYFTCHEDRCP